MDLIELEGMTREQLDRLLDEADEFLDDRGAVRTPTQFRKYLESKAIALLFFEPSTRTRASFELAAKRLGAEVLSLSEAQSSVVKGESMVDTCRNLAAMGVDAFVVRHSDRHTPYTLKAEARVPIINAGNGSGAHPTQGLLDALTLRRAFGGSLEGKTVAIVGDIIHSRVARSDAHAFTGLGARVLLSGPSELLPGTGDREFAGAQVIAERGKALEQADALVVLRIQRERLTSALDEEQYIRQWIIDERVVADELKAGAFIMHPGPVIRGVEMSGAVADGPRSLIMQQVRCGVAVRQAVLKRVALGG